MTRDANRWGRIQDLFHGALERSAPERDAWLRQACAGDEALLAEVHALLASDPESGDVIGNIVETTARPVAATWVGRNVGPYRVTREIGRGGMGAVYLAVRADDRFERDVAIKVLRSPSDEDLRRRFAEERRILASLDHPAIVRLVDGGETADGLPYLVMDHVEGKPIDAFCESRSLSVRDRIRLFREVCAGVEYAHRHLVVHRDLKPSNLLIDREGRPRILDFGIAKLLEARPGGADTAPQARRFTPEYASPEQFRGEEVTTASDVYSLGVVLYGLLAGRRPYDLSDTSAREMERIVTTIDPPPPSTASGRKELAGDLDTIVAKALRKEPAERYGSVAELAADLDRHLRRLPIVARPDTWRYRTSRFVRRNRAVTIAGAVAVVSMLAATAISVSFGVREGKQRRLAERRFDDVRTLATTFLHDVDDALSREGKLAARELIVGTGTDYLDRLAAEARDDDDLRRDVAAGYLRVASIQGNPWQENLGRLEDGRESCRRGLELVEAMLSSHPDDAETLRLAALGYTLRAYLAGQTRSAEEVRADLERARGLRERSLEVAPATALETPRIDGIVAAGAALSQNAGEYVRAEKEYREALESLASLAVEYPGDARLLEARIGLEQQLAQTLQRDGRFEEAIAMLEPLRDSGALEGGPGRVVHARVLVTLGRTYESLGRLPDAREALDEALALHREFVRADPNDWLAQRNLVTVLGFVARIAQAEGRREDARGRREEAADVARRLVAAEPDRVENRRMLAVQADELAALLRELGRYEEALLRHREACETFRALAREAPTADARRSVAVSLYYLGLCARERAAEVPDEAGRALLEESEHAFIESRDTMASLRDEGLLPVADEGVIDMLESEIGRTRALRGGAAGAR
ncbi:MAG: serine/threonine-protein kinase [bacterium]